MSASTSDFDQSLSGHIALVTGAAGGLGSALVRALVERGATVVACDTNATALSEIASERVMAWPMNLADAADIEGAVVGIEKQVGAIDILIHAAVHHITGDDGTEARGFVDHTPTQVMETLAVSISGPTLLTQLVCKGMVRRHRGRIVFTGSMHRNGTPGLVMYAAAKAYLNALARGLFLELRPFDIISAVANPGGMNTPLHGNRYPWMLDPDIVARTIVDHLALPDGVAMLSFEMVPHHPEHPDWF